MNNEKEGERKFNYFVDMLGLKAKMKTLRTNHLEELADLEGDEFIIKCIEHIYDEFFNVYISKEFRGFEYEA